MIKSYPEGLSPKAFYLEDNITNSFSSGQNPSATLQFQHHVFFFKIKAELGLSCLKKSTYEVLPIVLSGV